MTSNSLSFDGLPSSILVQLQHNLQDPISRELHAFCHLCPPDTPAATELLLLNRDELLQLSQACKEAINQWCCCPRDYAAQPDAPSLTTRSSTLTRKVKKRDGCCVLTKKPAERCHGAHIFPYSLGKSQGKATMDLWKILQMFWGTERKERLQRLIFGDPNTISPNSKTLINGLYNMITLSPDAHNAWAEGDFTLEPLKEGFSQYEMRARIQYMPRHVENPKTLGVDVDPVGIEIKPLQNSDLLVDRENFSPIVDGQIIMFKTSDPVDSPLPHPDLLMLQYFLIRVLRMAGRAGQDMLQTFESDDDVSSIAASDAGLSEPYSRKASCHGGPDPASLHEATAGFSSTINMPREQPPDKTALAKHRLFSFLRAFCSTRASKLAGYGPANWLPRKRSILVKSNRSLNQDSKLCT